MLERKAALALAAAISMLRNRAETKRPKQSASAFAPR